MKCIQRLSENSSNLYVLLPSSSITLLLLCIICTCRLRITYKHRLNNLIALLRALKHIPHILRHPFKSLLESLQLILLLGTNNHDIRNLADENEIDPPGNLVCLSKSRLASL